MLFLAVHDVFIRHAAYLGIPEGIQVAGDDGLSLPYPLFLYDFQRIPEDNRSRAHNLAAGHQFFRARSLYNGDAYFSFYFLDQPVHILASHVIDIDLLQFLERLDDISDVSCSLHAAPEHSERLCVRMQRRCRKGCQRRRTHSRNPGRIHYRHRDSRHDIIEDQQSCRLRESEILWIPWIALDPFHAAGETVRHVGGHCMVEHVFVWVDADLGGHLIPFLSMCFHGFMDQSQRLRHVRTCLNAFLLRKPQDLFSQFQFAFQIIVFLLKCLQLVFCRFICHMNTSFIQY